MKYIMSAELKQAEQQIKQQNRSQELKSAVM